VADTQTQSEGGALGFVETLGLATAIEVADAMTKAARVRVKTVCNADAGLLSVVCEGGLAACKAAVDAGKAAAARMDKLLGSNLIARPYPDTHELVARRIRPMFQAPKAPAGKPAKAKGKGKGK
jgi:microcompartment protein CcmL/EutN